MDENGKKVPRKLSLSDTKNLIVIGSIIIVCIVAFLVGIDKLEGVVTKITKLEDKIEVLQEEDEVHADLDKRIDVNKEIEEGHFNLLRTEIANVNTTVGEIKTIVKDMNDNGILLTTLPNNLGE